MKLTAHQFVDRDTGEVRSERPFGDWIVNYLYCQKRERAPMVYQLLGSQWFSGFLGWVNYDFPLGSKHFRHPALPEKLRRRSKRVSRQAGGARHGAESLRAPHSLLALPPHVR